jgi:putative acetyltransferase
MVERPGPAPVGTVRIEPEQAEDRAAVRDVVQAAFVRHPSVADLVDLVRESPNFVPALSLVAKDASAVVGHVMLSHADLVEDGGRRHRVVTLSPLSVLPSRQCAGIGGSLVRAGIRAADLLGEPVVVLEGSPAYYPRFGFRRADELGITIDLPDWAPAEAAMVLPLSGYDPAVRGKLEYPPAFIATGSGR